MATPSTDPGDPDQNVFYIGAAGTYANFGTSVTIPEGSIGVFMYNGSWTKSQVKLFDVAVASDFDNPDASTSTDAVADEISHNLEALVGTTEDIAPKAEPRHPINETTTSKFANLQFGRNYGTGRIG